MKHLLTLLIFLSLSNAQPPNITPGQPSEKLKRPYRITAYSSFDSSIESSELNIELNEASFDTTAVFLNFSRERDWLLKLDLNYTSSSLKIESLGDLSFYRIGMPLLFVHKPLGNSQWAPLVYFYNTFSGDELNFSRDQLFISSIVGAKRNFGENLELTLGALYLETQGEPVLFPALALKYRFGDNWLYEFQGPKMKLVKTQNDITWGFTLENNGRIWHNSENDTELSFNQLQLGAIIDVQLNGNKEIRFHAGTNLLGSYETLVDREIVTEEDLSGGFFFSGRYTIKF